MKNNRELIEHLGQQIGLPDLRFSAEGICELVMPDGGEFFLEGAPDDMLLHLNGVVGYLHAPSAEVLCQLLSANYNGQATGAAALALNPGNPAELLLSQRFDVSQMTGIEPFVAALEAFLKFLAFWTDYLPQIGAAQAAGPLVDSQVSHAQASSGVLVWTPV